MMPPDRRTHWVTRILMWPIAPFDDRIRGLSLTRLLAVACFVMVAHEVFVHEKGLTWIDFWTLVLGICTAFGKKMVNALLLRIGLGTQAVSSEARSQVDVTHRQIQERREHGKEWDAEVS